jgi:uncharacterized membrane protein
MTASEFWLLVVAVIAACLAYWVGRIDGYWLRAEEERAQARAATPAPNQGEATS